MIRMVLEGREPFHCLEDCENSVLKYRLATSEKARALNRELGDVASQLTAFLGHEFDTLTHTLTGLSNACYAYWWVTGLSSALCQEKLAGILYRNFTFPHTTETEEAKQNIAQYILELSKRFNHSEIQKVREYYSLYLEECAEIGAYTFLYGLEWGYQLLGRSGLLKHLPDWEKIYNRLPLW